MLAPLSIRELTSLSLVSHRFLALANRALHARLLTAATLGGNELVLECYHPLSAILHPFMICNYLGTDPLVPLAQEADSTSLGPVNLGALYSRFKPSRCRLAGSGRERVGSTIPLAGLQMATLGFNALQPTKYLDWGSGGGGGSNGGRNQVNLLHTADTVTLDEFESFSQLCVMVSMLAHGVVCTTMTSDNMRLWREWLEDRTQIPAAEPGVTPITTERGVPLSAVDDPRVIWTSTTREVGLKIHVRKHPVETVREEEDPPTTYDIGIEGMRIKDLPR